MPAITIKSVPFSISIPLPILSLLYFLSVQLLNLPRQFRLRTPLVSARGLDSYYLIRSFVDSSLIPHNLLCTSSSIAAGLPLSGPSVLRCLPSLDHSKSCELLNKSPEYGGSMAQIRSDRSCCDEYRHIISIRPLTWRGKFKPPNHVCTC